MGKLGNISGKDAVKAFQKAGWHKVGQVGSQIRPVGICNEIHFILASATMRLTRGLLLVATLGPNIFFWFAVYIANTRGSHLDIAAMVLAGLLSLISFALCLCVSIVKKRDFAWWTVTAINATPLGGYLFLVALSSSV